MNFGGTKRPSGDRRGRSDKFAVLYFLCDDLATMFPHVWLPSRSRIIWKPHARKYCGTKKRSEGVLFSGG